MELPFTCTVAPMMGSPFWSTTVPLMVFCADAAIATKAISRMMIYFFIRIYLIKVKNYCSHLGSPMVLEIAPLALKFTPPFSFVRSSGLSHALMASTSAKP